MMRVASSHNCSLHVPSVRPAVPSAETEIDRDGDESNHNYSVPSAECVPLGPVVPRVG